MLVEQRRQCLPFSLLCVPSLKTMSECILYNAQHTMNDRRVWQVNNWLRLYG